MRLLIAVISTDTFQVLARACTRGQLLDQIEIWSALAEVGITSKKIVRLVAAVGKQKQPELI